MHKNCIIVHKIRKMQKKGAVRMKEDIVYGRRRDGRSPLVITCAGASYCDGSYHIARRGIPILVAEYVVSGRGVLVVDGEQYTPEAGDVYLVPPNSTHYYVSDRTNPWVKLWFNVGGTFIVDLLAAYGLTETVLLKNCPLRERFEEGLRELKTSKEVDDVLAARIIVPLLAELHLFAEKKRRKKTAADAVQQYIESLPPGAPLETKVLHQCSGRSVSQTIRIFKKEFGTTPYALFLERKLKTAKYLLKSTSSPVKEIALSLGWQNPCYFARYFKRRVGLIPSEYRNQPPVSERRSGCQNPEGND